MKRFKTDIIKSKTIDKKIRLITIIFYLPAIFYLFLYDSDDKNIYLKLIALIAFILGSIVSVAEGFMKGKNIGKLEIDTDSFKVNMNSEKTVINFNNIQMILLKFSGYGNWKSPYLFGTKNYFEIITENGEQIKFEFRIKNKISKDLLKDALTNDFIKNKFRFEKINGTYARY
jgi:hypothetical protein